MKTIDRKTYDRLYEESIKSPEVFWGREGKRISWIKPYTKVKDVSYTKEDLHIKWFQDGTLNACYNCLDRHLEQHGNEIALIWEGDDPAQSKKLTYKELHQEVCKFSNVLKSQGVTKGDRVTIYLPMIPEAATAMLACARIGAIHSVVFGGFSPESLANRIKDCGSKVLITADFGIRGGKKIPLKENTDKALTIQGTETVEKVIVVKHTGNPIQWNKRDIDYEASMKKVSSDCEPEEMKAEDPLFILYTSGSTGKPKGVLHTTGGYMVYASITHEYVFGYEPGDIYWCTADVGWITGHTYIVYGPLANRATVLLFEGVPNYPDESRFWQVIDKHKVTTFYTSPTAIRGLMRFGDKPVKSTSRKSLKLLGTVGEPINPKAWEWYYNVVGEKRCQIVDTWWQTETGGIMMTPLPGLYETQKPGAVSAPFFGVEPAIVDQQGNLRKGPTEGTFVILNSWPGEMRTVFQDHPRFIETYFTEFPGKFTTGDGARRDKDGDYWITGRMDDVINVSGHRLGTAEIESALDAHSDVVETAVVGFPHEIKGQGIYAFITLNLDKTPSEALSTELKKWVGEKIGPIAKPDYIQWAPALPKTRSGKIMRRILRKIAENHPDHIGDTSTLADPAAVESLIKNRKNA